MDQDVQSRVEELEQNVQVKDRELAQSQQELRQKVYRNTEVFSRTFISHYVRMYIYACAEGMAPKSFAKQLQFTKFTCAQTIGIVCFDCRRNSCIPVREI